MLYEHEEKGFVWCRKKKWAKLYITLSYSIVRTAQGA
jgi:hypothetical protein